VTLVEAGTPGRTTFLSQRVLEAPGPYINCRIVTFMGCLIFGGVNLLDRHAVMTAIRHATGRPKGLNAVDILHASAVLFPWIPVTAAATRDTELLHRLERGEINATISVWYGLLPWRLRRWSPNFTSGGPAVTDRHDGHELRLAGARSTPSGMQVLLMDPLGFGSYRGEWVAWSAIRPAAWGDATRVVATIVQKGSALSTAIVPGVVYAPPVSVTVPKGAQIFTYDPDALNLRVPPPVLSEPLTTTADAQVTVFQAPARPPTGSFVRLADGRYVRDTDATITPAPPPVLNCDAAVAAATAPLIAAIAAIDDIARPIAVPEVA
jgi:hypothetical protein